MSDTTRFCSTKFMITQSLQLVTLENPPGRGKYFVTKLSYKDFKDQAVQPCLTSNSTSLSGHLAQVKQRRTLD